MIRNRIRWRKSSFSGSGASACVECAELDPAWRKSSYSGSGTSECVECAELDPAWRKSSFSDSGAGECVELAGLRSTHAVRDSKNPDGPHLTLGPTAWQGLLATAKSR
jgi:hypothetical protein